MLMKYMSCKECYGHWYDVPVVQMVLGTDGIYDTSMNTCIA